MKQDAYLCRFFSLVLFEDKCGPGEYSNTGLVPCIPCAKSRYSNESMSKRCIQCPLDMTTEFSGSTHIQNCSSKFF